MTASTRLDGMRRWSLLAGGTIAALSATAAVGAPPSIDARAYMVVNPTTGDVLVQRSPDTRLPMASTTKMMTAIVVRERTELGDIVVVPGTAAAPGGSTSGLVPGERITVRNLLTGLMIGSGNDASVALAAHVGGSQERFVGYMNDEAAAMGLKDTRFANPHGLDSPGHYSTVRDLIALGERTLEDPLLRQVVAQRVATIPGPGGRGTRRLESENDLLAIDKDADGIKTGHTAGAGYSLVAHARRRSTGVQLYAAVIGSPSRSQRARDAKRLLDWGFAQYVKIIPLPEGRIQLRVPVRDRPDVTVGLTVDKPLGTTVRVGRKLRRTLVAPVELQGPLAAGTSVGEVTITEGRRVLGTRKLVVAEAVDGPSIAERIRSGFGRLV